MSVYISKRLRRLLNHKKLQKKESVATPRVPDFTASVCFLEMLYAMESLAGVLLAWSRAVMMQGRCPGAEEGGRRSRADFRRQNGDRHVLLLLSGISEVLK